MASGHDHKDDRITRDNRANLKRAFADGDQDALTDEMADLVAALREQDSTRAREPQGE